MAAEHADSVAPRGLASVASPDSAFDSQTFESALGARLDSSRWMGWRLRLLVAAALLGCLGIFLLSRALTEWPHVDATWRANERGQVELQSSTDPALRGLRGRTLAGVSAGNVSLSMLDGLALQHSARWLVDDAERDRHRMLQEQLARALSEPEVRLHFLDGAIADVQTQPRGIASLGAMYWLLAGLALVLYLVAMVVLLARPTLRNAIYALMSLCQAGNLVFIAVESIVDLGLPRGTTR